MWLCTYLVLASTIYSSCVKLQYAILSSGWIFIVNYCNIYICLQYVMCLVVLPK